MDLLYSLPIISPPNILELWERGGIAFMAIPPFLQLVVPSFIHAYASLLNATVPASDTIVVGPYQSHPSFVLRILDVATSIPRGCWCIHPSVNHLQNTHRQAFLKVQLVLVNNNNDGELHFPIVQ